MEVKSVSCIFLHMENTGKYSSLLSVFLLVFSCQLELNEMLHLHT